ncbi:hypothetical protein BJV78DRAFT_1191092 [Lactifluus subvellereus]|nr:hypothetical protein BJV78DRAFT_1191092 [Lactifluus subvellereus]
MEMGFSRSWMLFRLAVISQGMAARHAQRQASSEKAQLYASVFPLIGWVAQGVLADRGDLPKVRAKL